MANKKLDKKTKKTKKIKKIKKILVANRGEIAVRIIRACRDMGIGSVAVYSECDATALHVRMADEAYLIGESPSSASYLRMDRVLEAAKLSGADAIHPGYGFLAENSQFARECAENGIIFIGPHPETIEQLGDKLVAREIALKANLPVVPGADILNEDDATTLAKAKKIGFPILVKAAAGGGGKGMRVVNSAKELSAALESASSEAKSAFGDGRVFIEKFLERPRHIEIQILSDEHGHHIHLGERECSIQRRHQKVIEESPSPVMTEELRARMGSAATNIARMCGYVGAGTVEFMVDEEMSFYFLEVNTRLQVEHPVTELVTGLDLVREQINIAEGRPLSFKQDDIQQSGHAIECRIYAENPEENFMPSTGRLKHYRIPAGPGVRVDSGVVLNSEIPIYYDPMIAKLAVWGRNRQEAIDRTIRALEEYRVAGLETTIGFHMVVLKNEKFRKGDISTSFLSEEYPDNHYVKLDDETGVAAAIAVALDQYERERKITIGQSARAVSGPSWKAIYRRKNLEPFGGGR